MLDVTCHHHCPPLLDEGSCTAQPGCVWANATAVHPARCGISSSQEFDGKAWIGASDRGARAPGEGCAVRVWRVLCRGVQRLRPTHHTPPPPHANIF